MIYDKVHSGHELAPRNIYIHIALLVQCPKWHDCFNLALLKDQQEHVGLSIDNFVNTWKKNHNIVHICIYIFQRETTLHIIIIMMMMMEGWWWGWWAWTNHLTDPNYEIIGMEGRGWGQSVDVKGSAHQSNHRGKWYEKDAPVDYGLFRVR